jgi:hypothetical protein
MTCGDTTSRHRAPPVITGRVLLLICGFGVQVRRGAPCPTFVYGVHRPAPHRLGSQAGAVPEGDGFKDAHAAVRHRELHALRQAGCPRCRGRLVDRRRARRQHGRSTVGNAHHLPHAVRCAHVVPRGDFHSGARRMSAPLTARHDLGGLSDSARCRRIRSPKATRDHGTPNSEPHAILILSDACPEA